MRTLPGPNPVPRPWSPLAFLQRLPVRNCRARQAGRPRRKSELRRVRQPPRCARDTTPRSRHLRPGLPSFPRPTARRTRGLIWPPGQDRTGATRSGASPTRAPSVPLDAIPRLTCRQASPRNRDPERRPERSPEPGPRAKPRTLVHPSPTTRPGARRRSEPHPDRAFSPVQRMRPRARSCSAYRCGAGPFAGARGRRPGDVRAEQ